MDKNTIKQIPSVFKNLLIDNGISVDGIALFGSALTGRMHEDSDVDMIVISRMFEGKDIFERTQMLVSSERELIKQYRIPFDILKKTPAEYEQTQQARFYKAELVA